MTKAPALYLRQEGDELILVSPYAQDIVAASRAIEGRRWDGQTKQNYFPITSIRPVRDLISQFNIPHDRSIDSIPDQDPIPEKKVEPRLWVGGERLYLEFPYSKEIVQALKTAIPGSIWNPKNKQWFSPVDNLPAALEFAHQWNFAIPEGLEEELGARMRRSKELLEASYATEGQVVDIETAIDLLPYQQAGVRYLTATKHAILGDDPGLGKTAVSLAAVVAAGDLPMVVVSTKLGKLNWALVEIPKFFPKLTVTVVDGVTPAPIEPADIIVLNHDIVAQRADDVLALGPRALILDEAHAIRNGTASYRCPECNEKCRVNSKNCFQCGARKIQPREQWSIRRTEGVMRISRAIPADGSIYMLTGTPAVNRPDDLVPLLVAIDKIDQFGGRWRFKQRYCTGNEGAMPELNQRLRQTCYIRRTKSEVWGELPPLRNAPQILSVDETKMAEYRKIERDVVEYVANRARELAEEAGEDGDDAYWEKRLRAESAEHLIRINVLKNATAALKLESIVSWVQNFLDENEDEKIVLFAEHIEMVETMAERFAGQVVKIRGGVSEKKRAEAVIAFQTDPMIRVFIGNLQAASEVITLTAASNVAFLEMAWNYATHYQAVCRVYGRANDIHGCTAYWLLAHDTIDQEIFALLEAKHKVVSSIVDGVDPEKQSSVLADILVSLAHRRLAQ